MRLLRHTFLHVGSTAAQQVPGADPVIEHRFAAGLGIVSCL